MPWNVLAVGTFDMMYTYINVGEENSAHDSTILKHSIIYPKYNLSHPLEGIFQICLPIYKLIIHVPMFE